MYAIGRPSWASCTAVRARSGVIHRAAGWSTWEGTRTACGRTLKHDEDYWHLVAFTAAIVSESLVTGTACPRCLKASQQQ